MDTNKATKRITTNELRDLLEGMQKEIPDLKKQLSKARDLKSSNDDKIHLEPETLTDEEVSKNENVEPIDDGNAKEVIASKEFGGYEKFIGGYAKTNPRDQNSELQIFNALRQTTHCPKLIKFLKG